MNLVFASGFLVPQHLLPQGLFPQNLLAIDYFRGLRTRYEGEHKLSFPDVQPIGCSIGRARRLAADIQRDLPAGDLHIITHSMGGLDSRTLIDLGISDVSDRIKSLTTLSTPHNGSPVADFLLGEEPTDDRRALYDQLRAFLGLLKVETGALGDLTKAGAQKIPDVARSHPNIRYRSYAAVGRSGGRPTSRFLSATHAYIEAVTQQPNDGLVAFESAKYGDFQQATPLQGDHADIVGYNLDNPLPGFSAFDHFARYDAIIAQLP
jgi:triacylglycerol lipase